MTAKSWLAVIATGCFSPQPAPGQPCESWCPPPETCVAGMCSIVDDGGFISDTVMPVQGNYMFVTSEKRTMDQIGGVGGADAWCNGLARSAHLPGHYTAWVSSSTSSARDRLSATQPRGWYRTDGKPFADTLDDFALMGKVLYPPRVNERGVDVVPLELDHVVATGTTPAGDVAPGGYDCAGFTSLTGYLVVGYADAGTRAWTDDMSQTGCSLALRIYCFGDSENLYPVTVPPPPAGARHAFITRMGVGVSGGLIGMDMKCAAEATAAGLPGTYRAWLSTISAAANSRFVSSKDMPWVRSDNVTAIEGDFRDMVAALNVDAFGNYHYGLAWSGAEKPDAVTPASTSYDCGGWTLSTSGARGWVGDVERGSFSGAFKDMMNPSVGCSNTPYLYCLQE